MKTIEAVDLSSKPGIGVRQSSSDRQTVMSYLLNSNITDHIPNTISILRILSVPVLLYSSYYELKAVFIGILFFALISDAIDGYLARKFKVESALGAKLDSWGDMCVYLSIPVCAIWLYPNLVYEVYGYFLFVVAAYTAPIIASLIKFQAIANYHTLSAKMAGVVMSISTVLAFIFGELNLFKAAVALQVLVALENILITLKLPDPKSNVRSYYHLQKT